MTMKKGLFYASHEDLRKLFKLSEDYVITNVIHTAKSNEFEFVVYTSDQDNNSFVDANYVGDVRRKRI